MSWFPFLIASEVDPSLQAAFTDLDRSIREASYGVRDELTAATFAVDADGVPVDTDVKDAIMDATRAQLAFWAETGDDSGALAQVGGGSILSVTLPGGAGAKTAREKAEARRAPAVESILRSCPGIEWSVGY